MQASVEGMSIHRNVLSHQAYIAVRHDILTGKAPAGSQLVMRELSEKLGLSPTPIKAALTILEREGLVHNIPYRGFFVPEPTLTDVNEVYPLRSLLESYAAQLAAQNTSSELTNKLTSLVQKQHQALEQRNIEAYGDLDLHFHQCIWEASNNNRLMKMLETIHGQVRLFIVSSVTAQRQKAILREHERIINALAAGSAEQASNSMKLHIQNVHDDLIKVFQHLQSISELET